MKMHAVTSSQIKEIGHDPVTNTMAVRFSSGALYHYPNVDATEFDEFKNSKSVGAHFHKHHRENQGCKRILEKKEEGK